MCQHRSPSMLRVAVRPFLQRPLGSFLPIRSLATQPLARKFHPFRSYSTVVHYLGKTHSGPKSHIGTAYKTGLLCGASALVFLQIKGDDDPNGKTRSDKMFDLSRKQLEDDMQRGGGVLLWLNTRVLQPIFTFIRFCRLFMLMVPIIIAGLPVGVGLAPGWYHNVWFSWIVIGLQRGGPSFVKLGQWAASRSDIFPQDLCDKLSKLHSQAVKHSFAFTKSVVSSAFGKPFEECFAEFDEEPLGVGAMAQVYRAQLPPSKKGEEGDFVAVKVLHPHVETMVSHDLKIMMAFAKMINALPTMEWLSLPGEVATFGRMMQSQLDLRLEADNLNTFGKQFSSDPAVSFPKPLMEVCTRQLLVEHLVDGVSMEKVLHFARQDVFDRRVAALGLDAFLKMLLLNNFIHSDLHAGNIFLSLDDGDHGPSPRSHALLSKLKAAKTQEEWDKVWSELGNQNRITPHLWFIDAGLVTELNPVNRQNFVELFKAIATFDGYKAGELMIERSRTPETATNKEVFYLKTERLVNQVKKRTFALGSVGIGDLLSTMLDMVRQHHVRMESDFITVVISILLLEGIGRKLDPDLDIFKSALPVLRKVSQNCAAEPIGDLVTFEDFMQMLKVWIILEGRQFLTASVQDIYRCVKYDRLSPNN